MKRCSDYVGSDWRQTSANEIRQTCESSAGVWLGSACPADGKLGRCSYKPSGDRDKEIIFHYYQNGYDESSAKADCASVSGLWQGN